MSKIKSSKEYRFNDNPMEQRFFEIWARDHERNDSGKSSTLDYLLAKDPNHPNDEATERDFQVARSVIQWLGSPVGQSFLREVGFVPATSKLAD